MIKTHDSRLAPKFVVRLPEGLREEVEQEAAEADRSMNAVFVQATKHYLNARQQKKSLIDVLQRAVDAQQGFDIDAHAQMAADARRYRWLRDVAFDTPRQDLALRDRHHNMLIEGELDAEVDRAMQAYPGLIEQEVEPCEA